MHKKIVKHSWYPTHKQVIISCNVDGMNDLTLFTVQIKD